MVDATTQFPTIGDFKRATRQASLGIPANPELNLVNNLLLPEIEILRVIQPALQALNYTIEKGQSFSNVFKRSFEYYYAPIQDGVLLFVHLTKEVMQYPNLEAHLWKIGIEFNDPRYKVKRLYGFCLLPTFERIYKDLPLMWKTVFKLETIFFNKSDLDDWEKMDLQDRVNSIKLNFELEEIQVPQQPQPVAPQPPIAGPPILAPEPPPPMITTMQPIPKPRIFELNAREMLLHEERVELVNIIAKRAGAAGNRRDFLSELYYETNWAGNLRDELTESLDRSVSPKMNAIDLLRMTVESNRVNAEDERYTNLGSFLETFIQEVGLEDQIYIASLMYYRSLLLDKGLQESLRLKYQIPILGYEPAAPSQQVYGPPFVWQGPTDQIELQSFLNRSMVYDMKFIRDLSERAYQSICQITIPQIQRCATGFLVAPKLVLTNYHVLKETPADELLGNARLAELYFGNYQVEEGKAGPIKLDINDPVAANSPELDFVLLRADNEITNLKGLKPFPMPGQFRGPEVKSALNILQHPEGGEMKIAFGVNGVVNVDDQNGKIQYVTAATWGSSGSPCFDDKLNLVALHHAEIPTLWGRQREGILISHIHEKIKSLL